MVSKTAITPTLELLLFSGGKRHESNTTTQERARKPWEGLTKRYHLVYGAEEALPKE